MKTSKITNVAGMLVLLVFSGPASGQHQPDMSIEVHRISERVIVLNYLDVNVTAIASEKGLVIVDTQRSPCVMRTVLREIEREFQRPDVLYVINTHGHADHTGGNQVFPDSIIVGHANCPEFMRQYPANAPRALWFARIHLADLDRRIEEADEEGDGRERLRAESKTRTRLLADLEADYRVTPPTITFQDSLKLDLGDLTLELKYCGYAHTTCDIFVYVPQEQIVIAGDMFNSALGFGFAVNQVTDVPRIMAEMDNIAAHRSGVKYVITGHSNALSGADFAALRKSLEESYREFEGRRSAAKELQRLIEDLGINRALPAYHNLDFSGPGGYYVLEEEFNALGYYFLCLGLIDEAVGVLATGLEHFPESALLYDSIAEAYLKQGNPGIAAEKYERSLEIAPYNRNAEEMLKLLAADFPTIMKQDAVPHSP
jgi:glyoxylase-like metal-dependent hydrolase (beta-lactamase superfamily II)